jgi:flagellar hook assembly protein FlgD
MSLSVYDVAGRLVRVLYHGRRDSGYHRELWDGRDDVGHPLGSGVYFLRLSVDDVVRTSKALLLK